MHSLAPSRTSSLVGLNDFYPKTWLVDETNKSLDTNTAERVASASFSSSSPSSSSSLPSSHGYYVKHPAVDGGAGVIYVETAEEIEDAVSKLTHSFRARTKEPRRMVVQEAIPSLLLPKGPSKFDLRTWVLHIIPPKALIQEGALQCIGHAYLFTGM